MTKALEAFRTISEVAEELDVQKHVLRFWENKFPQVHPMKRGGGRRYYRPDDLDLLRGIRCLLHREGYTIKGVQKLLREQGLEFVKECWQGPDGRAVAAVVEPAAPAKPGRKPRKQAPAATVTADAAGSAAAGALSKRTDHIARLEKLLADLDDCRRILRGADVAAFAGNSGSRAQRAQK
ncbi:MAG: MerR family transcriptional regulator [Dongiaceae bacterium]